MNELVLASYHNWRKQHPDRYNAYMRLWRKTMASKDYRERRKLSSYKYWTKNKAAILSRMRERAVRIRHEVLLHYSNGSMACACCHESTSVFLTIDHIRGGGNNHRRTAKYRSIYSWLKLNRLPRGFRVLCFNCNLANSINGSCPHQISKLEAI